MASPQVRRSRNRYQTPLPFDATTVAPELKKRKLSSARNTSDSRASFDSPARVCYNTRQDSAYHSKATLAVTENDAWLPYQRPARKTLRDDVSTQATIQEPRESLSSRPSTGRNLSSGSRQYEPIPRNSSHHSRGMVENGRRQTLIDTLDLQSDTVQRKSSTGTILSWRGSPTENKSTLAASSGNQGRSSFDRGFLRAPQRNPSIRNHARDALADAVDGSAGSEDSRSTSDVHCPSWVGMRTPRPRSRSNCSWTGRGPRSVQLETVNGVRLDTMPANPRSSQIGLCIPEIEARDIRQIEDDQYIDGDYAPLDDASGRHRASSPPSIGARQDFVRNISPRPPIVGRDHVFVDNYSRAGVQCHCLDALIEQPEEHSRERPRVPTQPPARFSEDVTQGNSSGSNCAPSPSIARTRAFDMPDAEMTSKTKQVRDLLKAMLKGFVPYWDKHTAPKAKNESTNDGQRPVSKGSIADRDSFEEMLQRTIMQGQEQRANAQISTHG